MKLIILSVGELIIVALMLSTFFIHSSTYTYTYAHSKTYFS
jgi:hypothetical protein